MRELLMVAYLFPPLGGGGVQRSVSFAAELARRGWRVRVLSAGPDARYWARDPSLLEKLPPEVELCPVSEGALGWSAHQLRRLVPSSLRAAFDRAAFFPDRQVTWLPGAWAEARRALNGRDVTAIYSTGSPWTNHLLGMLLAKEFGRPWVADYRDPYTQNQTFETASPLHAHLHRALEAEFHRRAALIIANTLQNLRALHQKFPATAQKSIALPNGYDEDDFLNLPPAPQREGRAVLAYAGSFYPGYGPERLFALLRRALTPALADALTLRFVGKTSLGAGSDAPLPIEEFGYRPHREALALLATSDATLLLLPPAPSGRSGWVPQKLYQYLRLGRPILALCPEGEASALIRAAGGGSVAIDPEHPEAAALLRTWLSRLLQGEFAGLGPEVEIVRRFDRRAIASELANALEHLESPGPERPRTAPRI